MCSVTLSHNNIYACLVDGKYFQGRGKTSPAYAHALNEDHHVFINLETQKVYVLPDGYEVNDASLADIQYLLKPTFDPSSLERIDRTLAPSYDLVQKPYHPGFIGLNNMKFNSYMNAVLQLVLHVPPLRDYFILSPLPSSSTTSELVRRFAMLARKVWNPRQFKAQVSPHEFLQEVANASHGRFKITEHGDPIDFLSWLLNQLHRDLGGSKRPRSSESIPRARIRDGADDLSELGIIYSTFQGEVRVDDQQIIKTGEFGTKPRFDLDRGERVISHASQRQAANMLGLLRNQIDEDSLPLPRPRSAATAPVPRCRRIQHHSASSHRHRPRQVRWRNYPRRSDFGSLAALENHPSAALPHRILQAVHQQSVLGGEESDNRQLPAARRRHARLYVS